MTPAPGSGSISASFCERGSILILASSRRAAVRSAIGRASASCTGRRPAGLRLWPSAVEKGQVTHEYAQQAHLFLAASPWEEEVAAVFNNGEVRWRRRYLKGRLRRRWSLGG